MPDYRVTLDNGQQLQVTTDTEVSDPAQLQGLIEQHLKGQAAAPAGGEVQPPVSLEAGLPAPRPDPNDPGTIALPAPDATTGTPSPWQALKGAVQGTQRLPLQGGAPAPATAPEALATQASTANTSVLTGAVRGTVQAADAAIASVPSLVEAGGTTLLNPVLEQFGYESTPPQPGTTRYDVLRGIHHPLETLQAGPEGFPQLEGPARIVQDTIRQVGGTVITSRLAHQLVPALQSIGWGDAAWQAAFGDIGRRIGETYDSPYGPVLGELYATLVGQVGVDKAKDVWMKLNPAEQAKRALGGLLRGTDQQLLKEHLATAERLTQQIPGLRLTPFQATDTPELLAVQQVLEKQNPDLAQQLLAWRIQNQRLLQKAFGDRWGQGGYDPDVARQMAIDGLRLPYQQKMQTLQGIQSKNVADIAQAEADLQTAQWTLGTAQGAGDTAKLAASQQVHHAQQKVAALQAQRDQIAFQMQQAKLQFQQERASLLVTAEQQAAGNLASPPPGTQPLTYTERLEATIQKSREIMEERFKLFRDRATELSNLVDPGNAIRYPAAELEKRLDKVEALFRSEGFDPPPAIEDIRDIVRQARKAQGGGKGGQTPPEQMMPSLRPDAQAPDSTQLSFQDLRNAQSRANESDWGLATGSRQKRLWGEMRKEIEGAMDKAAAAAGDPGALARYKTFTRFWGQNIGTYTEGIGEMLLSAKYLPPGGRTGALLPEEAYDLTHAQVMRHLWDKTPIAGNPGQGVNALEQWRSFVDYMQQIPEGMEAMRAYLAQDFYEKVVDKYTRQLNPEAMATWFRDHEEQLAKVPALKALYETPPKILQELALAENNATKLLEDLGEKHLKARQALALERQGPLAQARQDERVVKQQVRSNVDAAKAGVEVARDNATTVKQTAADLARTAQQDVNDAVQAWQDALQASPASMHALRQTTATTALGTSPEELIANVNAIPGKNQRAFALGRLTEPIKNDPQAVAGLAQGLWENYVETHGDTLADPLLAKQLPLSEPQLVMSWLHEHERWIKTYMGPQHYTDLMDIARGLKMNSMAGAAGDAAVPSALKQVDSRTRLFNRLLFGGLGTGIGYLTGGVPWAGLGATTGATVAERMWNTMSNNRRLDILRDGAFHPEVSHLMTLWGSGKADPQWLQTVVYGRLQKMWPTAATHVPEIADVMDQTPPY